MILPDWMIETWAKKGGVEPFDVTNINPASIDLRIGKEFVVLNSDTEMSLPEITIWPGTAILATTMEYIKMPNDCAGVLYLKSSMARQGLDHALAGWIDPGFEGEITMELHAHRPVTLTAGQRIIQLVLYQMEKEPCNLYSGRYQGQRGPTPMRGEDTQ